MSGGTEGKDGTEGTEAMRLLFACLFVASVASVPSVPSFAAGDFTQAGIGTSGANELTLPVGARGIAMGEAVSAVTDDVTSIHWNPAGLAAIPTGSASFMQSFYLGDINYQYAAFGHRIGEQQVLAGSVQLVDYGNIDHRDVNNLSLGSFHPRSNIYSVGYAQQVKDFDETGNLTAGFSAKYLHSTIIESADSYALDIGFRAKLASDYAPTQVAFVAQNLGIGPKYDQRRENLPTQLVGSTAFMPGNWTVALELAAPRANQAYGAVGIEYKAGWTRTLNGALRAGYNSLTQSAGPSGLHGFAFGVGLEVTGLSFDYAIVPFGDLGMTHQFSINYSLPKFEED